MSSQARPVTPRSHRTFWLIGFAVLACLAIGGIALEVYSGFVRHPTPAAAATPAPPTPGVIRVSRVDCFTGELRRLEPHLNMRTGCVHLEFEPPARHLSLEPELWQGGMPVGRRGFMSGYTPAEGPVDVSISLAPGDPTGKAEYRVTVAALDPKSSSSWTSNKPAPPEGGLYTMYRELSEPIEIGPGPPVAVWACLAYKKPNPFREGWPSKRSIEEAAQAAEWAIVLKLAWGEPDFR